MEEEEAGRKVGGKRRRILDVTSSQLPESPAPVLLEAPAPALPESRDSVLPESRASMLPGSRAPSRDFIVFLSDALSVLEATAGDKLPRLPKSLHGVGQHKRVALQWVPAHCSLPGNEKADDRARQSWNQRKTTRQQRHLPQKTKTLIRAALGQRTERDDFHFLDRWQQVVVKKLRTGHNRLNALMFKKMKPAPLPTSNMQLEDQTAEHILQRCPLLQTTRQTVWPTAVQLHTHQTLQQQGETGEDGHIHLADWTFSVAAMETKENRKGQEECRDHAPSPLPPTSLPSSFFRIRPLQCRLFDYSSSRIDPLSPPVHTSSESRLHSVKRLPLAAA